MSIYIHRQGILDSFQDLGRSGYQAAGINPGGAMDRFTLKLLNILLGNPPGEAQLEMHFPAAIIHFRQPALIAVGGADFSPRINGVAIPLYQPIWVHTGDQLDFKSPVTGARAYLAVAGGFDLPVWLGSRSTNLVAASGGFRGRALQAGDEIFFRKQMAAAPQGTFVLPWKAGTEWGDPMAETAVLPGREWNRLTDSAKHKFTQQIYQLGRQSDRMGYRFNQEPLESTDQSELISTGVTFGTLQLLPDGHLILLMADHQTTGGYPRVAQVITAHLPKTAQVQSGQSLQFKFVHPAEAELWYYRQEQHLLLLQNACTFRWKEFLYATGH